MSDNRPFVFDRLTECAQPPCTGAFFGAQSTNIETKDRQDAPARRDPREQRMAETNRGVPL